MVRTTQQGPASWEERGRSRTRVLHSVPWGPSEGYHLYLLHPPLLPNPPPSYLVHISKGICSLSVSKPMLLFFKKRYHYWSI